MRPTTLEDATLYPLRAEKSQLETLKKIAREDSRSLAATIRVALSEFIARRKEASR